MDDLREIRTVLAKPEPSPEVVARRRRQLHAAMSGRAPRRRARLLLVPVAAAAVAAAVVVAVARPGGPPPAVTTARDVLLVAATTAERTPEGSGTYWHITVTVGSRPPSEYWYRRDGQFWIKGKGLKGEGKLFRFTTKSQPFIVGPLRMSFDELRGLPVDEDALYTRLRSAIADGDVRTSAGAPSESDLDGFTVETLVSLVSEAPVSPQVRAAAYRALASRPGVTDLGETDDGRRLRIPMHGGDREVVVDPETARVRNTPVWAPLTGGLAFTTTGEGATIDAEWTDELPAE
ncbi:CU044_5270 family protein [Nonomuraea rhodomycinica]|uniref:CU044_5270 family protein n=1 Tax=Nonomuraea rhodomycinica TaxID=1712872 RepID=A0A7Y6IR98_9ACTN|nr:CU044_5270 family protein [Nonomuraea rhodomycinica]NUW42651.1 CU044_5270 family protein [Nonomuraea rhodomycinica]